MPQLAPSMWLCIWLSTFLGWALVFVKMYYFKAQ